MVKNYSRTYHTDDSSGKVASVAKAMKSTGVKEVQEATIGHRAWEKKSKHDPSDNLGHYLQKKKRK
jgi:hypothetical protein